EDGEAGVVLDLEGEVDVAAVELVVRHHHRVGAHRGHRLHLRLTGEEVEDRGALEAVAAVEVEHAGRTGALATDDVPDPRRAADVGDGERVAQAEPVVDLPELEVVREEARVDVGRVDQGQVDLTVEPRGMRVVVAPGRAEGEARRGQQGEARGTESTTDVHEAGAP